MFGLVKVKWFGFIPKRPKQFHPQLVGVGSLRPFKLSVLSGGLSLSLFDMFLAIGKGPGT